MSKVYIREIFLSLQGEGPYVGEQQLFIRFCGCNLNCDYCDTDFEVSKSIVYTAKELIDKINSFGKNLTLSLTGGEPLVSIEFLKEFLPLAKNNGNKIYLETNGTLPDELGEIIDFVDIISADIKLFSATKQRHDICIFEKFFDVATKKEVFAKIVFDENITQDEVIKTSQLAQKYNILIILQPKMKGNDFGCSTEFMEKIFLEYKKLYCNVRLIPQMHKFLNVR
jgi:organic radical activating enzyme